MENHMKIYEKYSPERTQAIVTNRGIRFIKSGDALAIAQSPVAEIHTFGAVLGGGADPAVMPAASLGEHIVHGGSQRVFRLHRFGRYYILRTDMYGDGSWHFEITSRETHDALIERYRADKRWKACEIEFTIRTNGIAV
jgi:hypothetical protein